MPQKQTDPEAQRLQDYAVQKHAEAQDMREQYLELAAEVQDLLLQAWRAGASPVEMADELGVGRVRVYRLMDKAEKREVATKLQKELGSKYSEVAVSDLASENDDGDRPVLWSAEQRGERVWGTALIREQRVRGVEVHGDRDEAEDTFDALKD